MVKRSKISAEMIYFCVHECNVRIYVINTNRCSVLGCPNSKLLFSRKLSITMFAFSFFRVIFLFHSLLLKNLELAQMPGLTTKCSDKKRLCFSSLQLSLSERHRQTFAPIFLLLKILSATALCFIYETENLTPFHCSHL